MSLTVTLTGTGIPLPNNNRAGGGVLVQTGELNLQFDAGRATSMRLSALGLFPTDIDVVFLTHHHSDHLQGLDDLVFTRQIRRPDGSILLGNSLFHVIAPDGPIRYFLDHLLDSWKSDFEVRSQNRNEPFAPTLEAKFFKPSSTAQVIWEQGDVKVSASTVQHDPVRPAVGYRVDSPDGSVVVSGDTSVCDEILELANGAHVLVHEAMLTDVTNRRSPHIVHYHSDSVALGELAMKAGVKKLMLTHLIPPPEAVEGGIDAGVAKYEQQIRQGGFTGELFVGEDLMSVSL